jgi:DNA-binding Lrp family transcriptional regulator
VKINKPTDELPDSFTAAPDALIERYGRNGLIPASIWGKVFRYTKMEHRVCKASILRMSGELGISPKTFSKYLKKLITDGFITDLAPDVEFSTRKLICTEKIHDETENWFADKKLKEAKLPWADPEKVEILPASKQVIPEGNKSLPDRDDVPPKQGPGTDKYSNNIASNIEKDIKSEVGETKTKSVSPTSQAGIPKQESIENNFGDYLPALEAEGVADGTAALSDDRVTEFNTEQKANLIEERDEEIQTNELIRPQSEGQAKFLQILGLEAFMDIDEKMRVERFEKKFPHTSDIEWSVSLAVKEGGTSTVDETLNWIEENENRIHLYIEENLAEGRALVREMIKDIGFEVGGK